MHNLLEIYHNLPARWTNSEFSNEINLYVGHDLCLIFYACFLLIVNHKHVAHKFIPNMPIIKKRVGSSMHMHSSQFFS